MIRLARSSSISSKVQYGVQFNTVDYTATLFKDIVNPAANSFDLGDSVVKVLDLPPEFSYMSTDLGGDVLVFQPNGSAGFTGGGNIVCLAQSEDLIAISQISVLASTGRIKILADYY